MIYDAICLIFVGASLSVCMRIIDLKCILLIIRACDTYNCQQQGMCGYRAMVLLLERNSIQFAKLVIR